MEQIDRFQSKVVSATAEAANVNFRHYSVLECYHYRKEEGRPWMLKIQYIERVYIYRPCRDNFTRAVFT